MSVDNCSSLLDQVVLHSYDQSGNKTQHCLWRCELHRWPSKTHRHQQARTHNAELNIQCFVSWKFFHSFIDFEDRRNGKQKTSSKNWAPASPPQTATASVTVLLLIWPIYQYCALFSITSEHDPICLKSSVWRKNPTFFHKGTMASDFEGLSFIPTTSK